MLKSIREWLLAGKSIKTATNWPSSLVTTVSTSKECPCNMYTTCMCSCSPTSMKLHYQSVYIHPSSTALVCSRSLPGLPTLWNGMHPRLHGFKVHNLHAHGGRACTQGLDTAVVPQVMNTNKVHQQTTPNLDLLQQTEFQIQFRICLASISIVIQYQRYWERERI